MLRFAAPAILLIGLANGAVGAARGDDSSLMPLAIALIGIALWAQLFGQAPSRPAGPMRRVHGLSAAAIAAGCLGLVAWALLSVESAGLLTTGLPAAVFVALLGLFLWMIHRSNRERGEA